MNRDECRDLADQMIGAAQVLERAAKVLKAEAKLLRTDATVCSDAAITSEIMLMHKVADVRRAAAAALLQMGVTE